MSPVRSFPSESVRRLPEPLLPEPLVAEAATRAWAEAEEPVPASARVDERLVHAARTAVLAPSVFNTQPWAFQPRGGGALDLLADRTRQLPALDPDGGRLLTVSCGAALFLLRLGAARNGLRLRVRPLPDLGRPDLLATVEVVPGVPDPDLLALAPAVARQRTHRGSFEGRPLADVTLAALDREARSEGAALLPAPDDVAALVAEATVQLRADEGARRDLAAWLRPLRASAESPVFDGVAAGERDAWASMTGADTGLAPSGEGPNAHAPAVLVLATEADNPFEWLAAGQAHARVLLRATLLGVTTSTVLAPLLVPDVRGRLAESLVGLCPHVVLRAGYAALGSSAPSPRRPLSAVLR